jgi:hypothetical protein
MGGLTLSLTTYLFLQAGKSGRSLLLHPLVLVAIMTTGQFVGHGVAMPIAIPALLAITKSLEGSKAGLPAPPTRAYVYTLGAIQVALLVATVTLLLTPGRSDAFRYINAIWQSFPLWFLALVPISLSRASSKGDSGPMPTQLIFQVLRWALIPAHYLGVAAVANAYLNKRVPFTNACVFVLA